MGPPTRLLDLTLPAFTARLAARTPTPGGGSTAAYLVDVGCALTAMACRFTSGEKFRSVENAMVERVEELERLRTRAQPQVDLDTRAYDAVTAAYKLPKSSDAEKAARAAVVQDAVLGALDVPADTLSTALAALRIAALAAPDVNPNLASDAATAAWCLRSAAEAAFYNVRINAGSLANKTYAAERLEQCAHELAEARDLAERSLAAIEKKLG